MATAGGMTLRSLRLIGDKTVGDSLTTTEQTAYLADLNSMLDSWRTENLFVYRIVESAFTLTVGFNAYTIGPSGNFNVERPERLENTCFILYNNAQYVVEVVDEATFTSQQTNNQSQMPKMLYYDKSVPLGSIYFDFSPDKAYDFHLKYWASLQSFATMNDVLTLPSGYQRAIEFNFAVELSGGFLQPSAEVTRIANESKAAIKKMAASRISYARLEAASLQSRRNRSGNSILTGA